MASDNLMTMEQRWQFRPTFADAWISDFLFAKETDTLTKALQKTLAATSSDGGDAFSPDSFFPKPETAPLQTPTPSGGSENEAGAAVSKPRRSLPPSGRVSKRKSRASKRAATTFITADPANFMQMVQQVTGVRFGGQVPAPPLLKPEPHRAMDSRLQPIGGLATLDSSSSAYGLLDGSGSHLTAVEFDSFCSFPTLESSKVMELWNNL